MDERLEQVIQELEDEQALNRVSATDVFRSILNQPELIAISSANAVDQGSGASFSTFKIDLPRPALDTETIQLVNANIPQCVQNIPDTATTFFYYRLSQYSGSAPNPRNLYFIRLLPSYYKPEFFQPTPAAYGQNKTFQSYQEVADELALSCQSDLAFTNLAIQDGVDLSVYKLNYLPGEITIPYDASINKFQMIGTNAETNFAYVAWNGATTYANNAVVYVGTATYKSKVAGNIGNDPTTSPNQWLRVYVDIVAVWDVDTPYRQGQYVAFNEVLYYAQSNVIGGANPLTNPAFTTTMPTKYKYRYLVAGFRDPNIPILAGRGRKEWNEFALFEFGESVMYEGQFWSAAEQNKGFEPFSTLVSVPWNNTTLFRKGNVVSVAGVFYKAQQDNINITPSTFSSVWTRSYWIPSTQIATAITGLNLISQTFDMVDTWDGDVQYPFPVGIPPQPFNPTPRRILNSILGFTWNGIMTPSTLANVDGFTIPSSDSNTTTELFNRLRPVPQYFAPFATPLLSTSPTANETQTFTAEGFCNLVYSSIISIYSTIVAGSTLNTETNTNLLAMGTMACGNLGVSFFNPYINNPLTILGDVISLQFTFRDEFNEPYVFTNNAVITLVLKLTYSSKILLK